MDTCACPKERKTPIDWLLATTSLRVSLGSLELLLLQTCYSLYLNSPSNLSIRNANFLPKYSKMTATTMHFGPEWMRPKHALRPQNPPSPPPNPSVPSGVSSYSALLTPPLGNTQEPSDSANPFLYSKEDLLKIYKDGGGRRGLGLDVERWEGVVREVGSEPVALKEWSEGERKVQPGLYTHVSQAMLSSSLLSFSQVQSIPRCVGVSQATTCRRFPPSLETDRNYPTRVLG